MPTVVKPGSQATPCSLPLIVKIKAEWDGIGPMKADFSMDLAGEDEAGNRVMLGQPLAAPTIPNVLALPDPRVAQAMELLRQVGADWMMAMKIGYFAPPAPATEVTDEEQ